mgnify:CR=1 FL=1
MERRLHHLQQTYSVVASAAALTSYSKKCELSEVDADPLQIVHASKTGAECSALQIADEGCWCSFFFFSLYLGGANIFLKMVRNFSEENSTTKFEMHSPCTVFSISKFFTIIKIYQFVDIYPQYIYDHEGEMDDTRPPTLKNVAYSHNWPTLQTVLPNHACTRNYRGSLTRSKIDHF